MKAGETKTRTVVFGPPAKVPPPDDVVEDKADEHPGHKVERRRGRQGARAHKNDREAEVLEEIDPELFVQYPLNERRDGPSQEEEHEAIVQLALREQTLWPNHTPLETNKHIEQTKKKKNTNVPETYDNRCGAENGGRRADKAVCLGGRAEVLDVGEHPRLHAELHGSSDDRRDDLAEEHRARCDLHVVAELKVARELQRLHHGDIAPRLEQHHRDRAAGQGISDDQLRDDVEPNLLIRDGLDHADGDGIHGR